MKYSFSRILCLLALMLVFPFLVNAQNPAQVLDRSVSKLNKASGVNCKFRIVADNNTVNGVFKSSGKRFYLETQAGKTWYDGEKMWTSNPRSKEITLVNPTSQEINEVNPFAYMNSYRSDFIVGFSKRKDPDRYLVVLNPKKPGSEVKAVEVAINKKTMLPERFIIRDSRDRRTTLYVDALATTVTDSADTFSCPSELLEDYELVDLR